MSGEDGRGTGSVVNLAVDALLAVLVIPADATGSSVDTACDMVVIWYLVRYEYGMKETDCVHAPWSVAHFLSLFFLVVGCRLSVYLSKFMSEVGQTARLILENTWHGVCALFFQTLFQHNESNNGRILNAYRSEETIYCKLP
jgi:hypothetical protein